MQIDIQRMGSTVVFTADTTMFLHMDPDGAWIMHEYNANNDWERSIVHVNEKDPFKKENN